MRLIDADKLEKDLAELYQQEGWNPDEVHFSLQVANNWGRTVEAIPIAWIDQWLKRLPKHSRPYAYKVWLRNAIRGMVSDWRKENDTGRTDRDA